jgi:putative membrane protein
MTDRTRRPATFRLDDPHVTVMDADEDAGRLARGTIRITPEADPMAMPVVIDEPLRPVRSGFRWGTLFWTGLGGLVLLGTGLGVTQLVRDLFAINDGLGFLGLGFAALVSIALIAIITREALSLMRLATIEKLHARALAVIASDDHAESRAVLADLLKLAHTNPRLARARTALQGHADDIIDGADLIRVAERELMSPLDIEARRLVSVAAQRVSVVTAVSPRAVVDVLFVAAAAIRLVRQLAKLYGGRPGTLGHDHADASCHQPSRHHRRHGRQRQHDPAGARPRHRRETLAAARRRRAQWPAHCPAGSRRDRRDAAIAVHGAATPAAWRSREGSAAQAGRGRE